MDENKISFKKKLTKLGGSYGIIIEKALLRIIGLDTKNIDEHTMIKVTIENAEDKKKIESELIQLVGEKMKKIGKKELNITLKTEENETEEEKQKKSKQ